MIESMPTVTTIVLPGYEDSGPDHWQSRWCRSDPGLVRITGLDWDRPDRESWVTALGAAIDAVHGPAIVVAHSLGAVTVACLGPAAPGNLVGALLVTPCDTETDDFPEAIRGFAPMPAARLPFRTVLVASRNDPWMRSERAVAMAKAWGSELVDAGEVEHLNTAAGFGPWPAGEGLLADLRAAAASDG